MQQLEILLSLFLVISTGFIAGRSNLLNEAAVKSFNKFIFYIAAPAIFFLSIATMDKSTLSDYPAYIVINTMVFTILYAVLFIFLRVIEKDRAKRGAVLYPAMSGNTIYFGFPLLLSIFGQNHLNYGVVYVVTILTLTDFVGFFLLTIDDDSGKEFDLFGHIVEFIKNPLVIASVIGGVFLVLNIQIPEVLLKALTSLGDTITGVALFGLGIYFSYNLKLGSIKLSIIHSFIKLLVLPALVYLAVYHIYPLDESLAQTSVLMAAVPAAAFSIVAADIYDLDKRLTTNNVIISSFLFLITSIIWFSVL